MNGVLLPDNRGEDSGVATPVSVTNGGTGSANGFSLKSATPAKASYQKLWAGAVTGTPVSGATLLQNAAGLLPANSTSFGFPQTGATLSQATSGATATVRIVNQNGTNLSGLAVGLVTGTFDTTHLVTGTNPDASTFAFTPTGTLILNRATITGFTTGGLGNRFNVTASTVTGQINFVDTITGTNPSTSTFTFVPTTSVFDVYPVPGATVTAYFPSLDANNNFFIEFVDVNPTVLNTAGQNNNPPAAIWYTADNEWESAPNSLTNPTLKWM